MPPADLEADYKKHGLANRVGFGTKPALLVIDFVKASTTPVSPLYAAPGVPDAVQASRPLLTLAQIVDELAPQEGDLVVEKKYASAFFDTHIAATLTALGCDTAIMVGCSTSGCIAPAPWTACSMAFG